VPFRHLVFAFPLVVAAAALACQGDVLPIEPTQGTLEITTATEGSAPDPDGYTVRVDAAPVQTIGAVGLVRTDASGGEHTVKLDGVAGNCVVEGENPRNVTVPAGDTLVVAFAVVCSSTAGPMVVTFSTTGSFPDMDGYTVTIDGVQWRPLPAVGSDTLSGIAVGLHQVGLSGVAANCRIQGTNPRTEEIRAGHSTIVNFEIECTAPAIAFTRRTDDDSNIYLSSVYLVNPDGSGLVRITPDKYARRPARSPDGSKVAFVSFGDLSAAGDLSVINADGTGHAKLFDAGNSGIGEIRWSPDGMMIAFEVLVPRICEQYSCVLPQLWLIHPDGTGPRMLAEGGSPAWSPDGRKIAFASSDTVPPSQLFTIDRDGNGLTQLTSLPNGTGAPTWAPDGERLAFSASTNMVTTDIFTIKSGGTGLTSISFEHGTDVDPAWSPDGTRIAFRTITGSGSSLAVMNPDGSARSTLTGNGLVVDFAWSPDAGKIAYTLLTPHDVSVKSDFEVYVVNADGTGVVDVSRSPAFDSEPTW
jgi:hypothetical protein